MNDVTILPSRWYSVAQVAEHLAVHHRTVRGWIRAGRLEAVKLGGVLRISEAALQAFVAGAGAEARTETELEA